MLFDGLMQRGTMLPISLFAIAFVRPASLVPCLINKLFENDASSTDDGSSQDPIKQLDDLPSHVRVDGNQLLALELVNIDSSIPVCNEWNGNRNFLVEIVSVYHIEDDDGQ